MSGFGMRIDDGKFEVGFTAATREEFDSYVERLQMVAATIWTKSEPDRFASEMLKGEMLKEEYRRRAKESSTKTIVSDVGPAKWREDHGLR